MPHTSHFPTRNPVFGKHRGQDEVEHVRLCRPETTGRRNDWRVVFITEHHEVTRFYRREESLQMRAQPDERPPDHIFRTGRRGGRGDQNRRRLSAQQC